MNIYIGTLASGQVTVADDMHENMTMKSIMSMKIYTDPRSQAASTRTRGGQDALLTS